MLKVMNHHSMPSLGVVCLMTIAASVGAQTPPPPGMSQRGPQRDRQRPPMEEKFQALRGRWWTRPAVAQKLGLSAEQQQQLDAIFQAGRLRVIDLTAALRKEQVTLEPLAEADRPDESKILAQIDRIEQARAELQKAKAKILLAYCGVLTPEQLKKARAEWLLRGGDVARPWGPAGPQNPRPHHDQPE
jgi:Spy/CpxP family protein refolding chaperone